MANPINFVGRVESDPMRIPTAASMSKGSDEPFDRILRDTVANDAPTPRPRTEAREEPQVVEPEASIEPEAPRAPRDEPARDDDVAADDGDGPLDAAAVVDGDDVTDSIRRGEPARQETAGKGADSPRTSTPSSEPLIAATLHSAQPRDAAPTGALAQQAAVQPTTARGGEPLLRGAATLEQAGQTAGRAQRAQAGYATRNAATAQMLEQARDSVFKQILMKLNDDGGEMRLRLQPPDLGELDLRLTVEGGNRLSLAIAAERPEMAQLLQRHLDELKQTLQQSGLEITGAEVQTRSEFERGQQAGADGGGASDDDQAEDAASAPRTRGYVTAEGLDFWA